MTFRLLADDLTGALDTAARMVPAAGPIRVLWHGTSPEGSAAIDSASRELDESAAIAAVARFGPWLSGGQIAFKKIDSMLRGHVAAELAACMQWFDHCVLAPAFPHQGRITRLGRQLVRRGDAWVDIGVDLNAGLRERGLTVRIHDAATDADLAAVVAEGRRLPGRVLWCGCGGLAGALVGSQSVQRPVLAAPLVAFLGTDHPVTKAQRDAVPQALRHRVIVADLPPDVSRRAARDEIRRAFGARALDMVRPGTVFVTGGETLRDLCDALQTQWLEVDGELEPGVPTSIMRGGL